MTQCSLGKPLLTAMSIPKHQLTTQYRPLGTESLACMSSVLHCARASLSSEGPQCDWIQVACGKWTT